MKTANGYLTEMRGLIHYGDDRFDVSKFQPVVDDHWIKPIGGLWASPLTSEFGWCEWCKAEDWGLDKLSTSFEFDIEGRIMVIDSVDAMNELSWIEQGPLRCISFECLMACGIDAVYLTWEGQVATRHSTPRSLCGWDCESVLIMNPEIVRV